MTLAKISYRRFGVICVFAWLGTSACSSTNPPTGAVSQAELAVRQAGQSKASQYAPTELSNARDKLDRAKRAMDAERYVEARRLAEQALADAQLAEARAEAEQQRRAASEMRRSIETLREEATRASTL